MVAKRNNAKKSANTIGKSLGFSLACMAFGVYKVVHVACHFRIWFVNYANDKRDGLREC